MDPHRQNQTEGSRHRGRAIVIFFAIAAILAAAGYLYFQSELQKILVDRYQTLAAIGELKVGQIYQWRRERISELNRAAHDSDILEAVEQLLASPENPRAQATLSQSLRDELTNTKDVEVLFFSPEGLPLASSKGAKDAQSTETQNAVRQALKGSSPVFSNFFRDSTGLVHIDIAAPVRNPDGQNLGAIVLRHDAGSYLFPLIQSWPTPSQSAETSLLQREGDEVVYLNNLKYRNRSALNIRLPISDTNRPAVQAVLGRTGIFRGIDYRNEEVVADLLPVPESPWFVVAKVDAKEILAEAGYRARTISIIIGLCILLSGALIMFFYRWKQARIVKGLLIAEKQRKAAEEAAQELKDRHRTILYAAMDGFCLLDLQGHILEVNEAYCRMTGYSEQELLSMSIKDLEAVESPEEARAHIQKIVSQGHDTFESRQRCKDGRIIDVEVSVQYQPEEKLMASFIRDITERKQAEALLVRNERMLRESQETADIGTYSLSLDTKMAWEGSQTLDRIFGIAPEYPHTVDGWSKIIHPDDRESALSEFQSVLAERKPFRRDYRIIRPLDGEVRWVGAYGHYEYDESGRPVRMIGCIQDITERKLNEAKIMRLSMLYSALSECNKAIVKSTCQQDLMPKICRNIVEYGGMKLVWFAAFDSAAGRIVPQASFGVGQEYLQDLELNIDPASPLGRGPTGRCFREGTAIWCQDFQHDPMTAPWHARGAEFGWRASASIPIRMRENTIGALTIYSDRVGAFEEDVRKLLVEMGENISFALDHFAEEQERREAEAELQVLRTGIEQSENTIVITNAAGAIEYANPAFEKSTGYTVAEAIGKNPRILNPGTDDPAFYRNLWMQIMAGKTWRGEFHNRRKDGTMYWESASISPVRGASGKIEHFIAVKEDITEKKRLETNLRDALGRAEAANRAKSEFLAVMSHELRTPLNGVLGFAELLTDTGLDDTQADYVKTIHDSGSHLLGIVSDILDFSSIEKGTAKLDNLPVNLRELLDGVCQTVRKSASDKGIQFRSETEADLPDRFLGDGRRTRQILLNLLGNAVKFTSKGLVTLRTARGSLNGDPALEFSVSDTGPGIAQDVLLRLFQPFTQGDSSLGRPYEGTGLGLAISKRLAEALGGRITVVSKPSYGSTFTVLLPLKEAAPPDAKPAGTPSTSGSAAPPLSGLVLVVEDDRANRMLAGKMVESLGYRVKFAEDGSQAVKAFSTGENLTAILMDMQMPVMDGLEATKRIRKMESGSGTRTPIIALTANVMPSDRARCMQAGMDDFLTKPFKKGQIAEKLRPDELARMARAGHQPPQNGQTHHETLS